MAVESPVLGRRLLDPWPHACFFVAILVGPLLLLLVARWRRDRLLAIHAVEALGFQISWCLAFAVFGAVSELVGDDVDPPGWLSFLGGITFLASIVMIAVGIQQSFAAVGDARRGVVHRYVLRIPWLRVLARAGA